MCLCNEARFDQGAESVRKDKIDRSLKSETHMHCAPRPNYVNKLKANRREGQTYEWENCAKKERKKISSQMCSQFTILCRFFSSICSFCFHLGNLKTFIAFDVAVEHCERVSRCCFAFLTISAVYFFFLSQILLFYF